jgi:hypothetical protein
MANNSNNWNFLESFFGGNVFPTNGRYIDAFTQQYPVENQIWGVKQAIWIDTNNAYEHYLTIPELRAVVDKRASMMSTGIPCLYDMNGEKVEKHWIYELINNPNPMQSWSDVIYCLSVNDALYSNAFAFCPPRTANIRNLLVPIPSHKMQIKLSGKTLRQMDIDGLIDGYIFEYDTNKLEHFENEEILYFTTTDGINVINPTSKIVSLKYPLSNIKASYNKRNVLLENIGAIGILSAQKSDMAGAIPMDPQEKRGIQQDWYRRSKDELIITEANVDWKPMSFPTRDLLLFEELTADKLAIIDAFGMNANLFSSETGSTFTNVRDSIRMVYNDTIIPETEQLYRNISNQMGLSQEGLYLKPTFNHIKTLQEDQQIISNIENTKVDILAKLALLGVTYTADEIKNIIHLHNEEY